MNSGIDPVFLSVVENFPEPMQKKLLAASAYGDKIQEIRLRSGRPILLTLPQQTLFLGRNGADSSGYNAPVCTQSEISECFEAICGYSVHAHREELCKGFVTMPGGHRVGIAGNAFSDGEKLLSVRTVTSLSVRIARSITGAADEIIKNLSFETAPSLLIAGPPGSGKTTLLRDLARQLTGGKHHQYFRTVVVDERCELFPDVSSAGYSCDVLSGYPRGAAFEISLRCLSPEIVICDEIGSAQDAAAIRNMLHCGVSVIASVHASSRDELYRRTILYELLQARAFEYVVQLNNWKAQKRIQEIYPIENGVIKEC